jgi:FixJ family two-component response regulator
MSDVAVMQQPTVFIVDDDRTSQRSVAALVEAMGHQTETFDSAAAFLAVYGDNRPGCLVTDWKMPEIDGLMLQEKLKARGCNVPVIVITAHACTPTVVQAMKLGAVTMLDKPYDDDKLWQAIQEALDNDLRSRTSDIEQRELQARLATLTPAEMDVLKLMLVGTLNKTTAKRLEVSLRTVEKRRQSILEKMQAESTAELVRLVLEARR